MLIGKKFIAQHKQKIKAIRKKLIAAEQAGFTDQTIEELWAEARQKAKTDK